MENKKSSTLLFFILLIFLNCNTNKKESIKGIWYNGEDDYRGRNINQIMYFNDNKFYYFGDFCLKPLYESNVVFLFNEDSLAYILKDFNEKNNILTYKSLNNTEYVLKNKLPTRNTNFDDVKKLSISIDGKLRNSSLTIENGNYEYQNSEITEQGLKNIKISNKISATDLENIKEIYSCLDLDSLKSEYNCKKIWFECPMPHHYGYKLNIELKNGKIIKTNIYGSCKNAPYSSHLFCFFMINFYNCEK